MIFIQSITGVNLNPSIGEFAYDVIPYRQGNSILNCFSDFSLHNTDLVVSINRLKFQYPACKTVNINVSWFCSSIDASTATVSPATKYLNLQLESFDGLEWNDDYWSCSGLNNYSNLPVITTAGTPSDQSLLRLISFLKKQGFKISFTPKLIVDGFDASEITSTATEVDNFVGKSLPSMFSISGDNINYTGNDFSYSRMVMHYATLCSVSGVDMFVVGSDLTGLETIRGPSWTVLGQSDGDGCVTWDYPFVAALNGLVDNVKTILPNASVVYAANWQTWMGITQDNVKIPHLDQLYSNPNIAYVAINNFQPLSDWYPDCIDEQFWTAQPSAISLAFPSSPSVMNNLGLDSTPSIYDGNYISNNIEGGENFSWYYDASRTVRNSYKFGQDLLATKRLSWWWNSSHKPLFDANDGMGIVAHGHPSQWKPQSKPIIFTDYGFNQIDKCTNEPSSVTPYYTTMINGYPQRDNTLYQVAFEEFYNYWNSKTFVDMNYLIASNWDVRSKPAFPLNDSWSLADYWAWFIKTLK